MPEITQPTAEVIDLAQRRRTAEAMPTHVRITPEVQDTSKSEPSVRREARFEEIYSAETPSHVPISRCRELLHGGAERSQEAQNLLSVGDEVGADQQMMLLQGTLPELFCCRTISEGLSAFVLALHYALVNQRGTPLDMDQLFAVRRGLEFIRENLFLSFDQSLDLIDILSNSQLLVDPPEMAALTDVFSEQQESTR